MFTGLIMDLGQVIKIERNPESARIEISSKLKNEIKLGDSVSVNGICLTAVEVTKQGFKADVMVQTLRLTSLAEISVGDKVNLELALLSTARLGGHMVQGHIDGIAEVIENSPGEKWNKFVVRIPAKLKKYVVNQGSIALDGVSLTVGEIRDDQVTIWLIPETLSRTNLASRHRGQKVNVEVDLLAKYVERLLKGGESSGN
jgi:riboflavin synthase